MNRVSLIGRTTKDIEVRYTQNNKAVAYFTLAVDGFKKDETDFITCVAWEKRAETLAQYVSKGDRLGVTGSIKTRSFDNKEGGKTYTTEVLVDGFDFLQPKTEKTEKTETPDFGQAEFVPF